MNNYYSEKDMQKMRQEAIIQAQEMQKRAKTQDASHRPASCDEAYQEATQDFSLPCQNKKQCSNKIHLKKQIDSHSGKNKNPLGDILNYLLNVILKDKDNALILIVLLLLLQEKCEKELLFAIGYLFL